MSKEVNIYCDRCGNKIIPKTKEVLNMVFLPFFFSILFGDLDSSYKEYELCLNCRKSFKKWLKEVKD